MEHVWGVPTRQRGGGEKRRAEEGIQIDGFSPLVEALDMAFFLVHGCASYTRWGSDAIHPLDGDVVGVTEDQRLRFVAQFVSAGARGLLRLLRPGAAVL